MIPDRSSSCRLATLALALSAGAQLSHAYPDKPVRLLIPFTPGGGVDATGRVLAQQLTEVWRQQVVVDNRAGASANIGSEMAAHAAPDGHTLLLTNNALAISAGLYPGLSYSPLQDLRAVTQILSSPFVLAVPASLPAKNTMELINLAKTKPGQVAYASVGVGSGPHLAAVLFASMAGTTLNHVPYKSGGSVMPDLIAGRVQLLFATPLAVMPHVRSGRLRALGVSTRDQAPGLPDVPAIAKTGVPGFDIATWYMLLIPAKTPAALVAKIQQDVAALLQLPEVVKVLGSEGTVLVGSSPAQAQALLRNEVALWTRVVKAAGVKPSD